ncbi:MAG: tetratricopeptide repeat protein [Bacteroidota bacterium]
MMRSFPPHSEVDWSEIEYLLRNRQKPILIVCTYDSLRSRNIGIQLFETKVPSLSYTQVSIFQRDECSMYSYLEQELDLNRTDRFPIKEATHILDLEYCIEGRPSTFLDEVNLDRELIFRELGALILWLNRYTFQRFEREAPDFWDWIQHKYHFGETLSSTNGEYNPRNLMNIFPYPKSGFEVENELVDRLENLNQSRGDLNKGLDQISALLQELGERYQTRFDYKRAIEAYTRFSSLQECLNDKANIGRTQHYLSYIYKKNRDYQRAIKALKKAYQIEEFRRYNEASILNDIGIVYKELREWEQAHSYLSEALHISKKTKDHNELVKAYYQMGVCLQKQKKWEEALEYFYKIVEAEKENNSYILGTALHQIGRVREEQGELEQALNFYNKALEANKNYDGGKQVGSTYHQIGLVYQTRNQWDKAIEFLSKAIDCNKNNGRIHELGASFHHIGIIYQMQKRWDEALLFYEKAIDANKRSNQLHDIATQYHHIGTVHYGQASFEIAKSFFEKAVHENLKYKLTDELGGNYFSIGTIYEHQGKLETAETYYKLAIEWIGKTDTLYQLYLPHAQLAMLYRNKKNFKKFKEHSRLAMKWKPEAEKYYPHIKNSQNPSTTRLKALKSWLKRNFRKPSES